MGGHGGLPGRLGQGSAVSTRRHLKNLSGKGDRPPEDPAKGFQRKQLPAGRLQSARGKTRRAERVSGSALMLRERGEEQGEGGGSRPERRKPRSVSQVETRG